MKKIIHSIILSFWCLSTLAQNPVSRHFGKEDLTCNLITEICQDDDGFIWIGTISGLNRYDGWNFRHIYANESDSTSLSSDYIYELFNDSQGRLWVGTNLGLQLYDRESDSFRTVHYPEGRSIPTEHIVELANGELWIVLGNIYRLYPEKMTAEPIEEINKLSSSSIVEVFASSDGTTWLSGNRGKIYRIKEGDVIQTIDTDVPLRSFAESEGELFAASNDIIYRWNESDSCFDKLRNDCPAYTQANLLSTHDGRVLVKTAGQGFRIIDKTDLSVLSMDSFSNKAIDLDHVTIDDWIEDLSGNIWLGSVFNGLVMISNRQSDFISMGPLQVNASTDEMINAVYLDKNSVIWAGSENGNLFRNEIGKERTIVQTFPGGISSITELDDRYLLAGIKYNGLRIIDKETGASRLVKGTDGLYIKKIIPSTDSEFAVSLFDGGVAFLDKSTFTLGRNIRAGTVNTIMLDKDGFLWCGTYGGVRCYNYAERSQQTLQTSAALNTSTVYSLFEDSDGIIWIGTSGGLFSYDKATETCIHHITGSIANEIICGIAGDRKGNIWISTFNGIIRFNPYMNTAVTYKSGFGLSDTEYVRGSYWQDSSSGMIFFGGQHDVTEFNPELITTHTFDRAPVLTELYVNDKLVSPASLSGNKKISRTRLAVADKIELGPRDDNLRLYFSTMDYRETENIQTVYSIDGDRETIQSAPGSNNIYLTNLKPGRHILKVRFTEQGLESPITSLRIQIRQPWYATLPAILVYVLFAIGLIYSNIRIIKFAARNKARNKLNEQKLNYFSQLFSEMRSPMTLLTIPLQKLLRDSENEEKERALAIMDKNAKKVMHLINQSVDVRAIDDNNDSIAFSQVNLVSFISRLISGMEYRASLKGINLSLKKGTDSLPVWIDPNLFSKAIMNILDNTIKTTPKGGQIEVEAKQNGKYAEISVKDTGNSFTDEQMEHLFELYYRASAKSISDADTNLFLSNAIIKHHKGMLTASNINDNHGRQYLIKIPVGNAHIPKKQISKTNAEFQFNEALSQSVYYGDVPTNSTDDKTEAGNRRYSIVAIDSSDDICNYISGVFDPKYKVHTFTSAVEGYNFILTHNPDLIITDLLLSDMDGLTLLKKVKDNSNTAHIPVLLMTAVIEEGIRIKGLLTGADAIITKPFQEEELILICTNLIMSRSRLANRIKNIQIKEELLQPVDIRSNNDVLLQRVVTVINENISNPDLDIDFITQSIGISRSHLHRKIKEITGMSPGEFIRSTRLNQAAELLKGEKKNISQIAYSLGYSSPIVFSMAFKSFFGITAKEYQDRYAGLNNTQQLSKK
jgi:ligand-binding sensor domain-containing protein/signal transduction histidine kinase/AraC-like DNA-binding protein